MRITLRSNRKLEELQNKMSSQEEHLENLVFVAQTIFFTKLWQSINKTFLNPFEGLLKHKIYVQKRKCSFFKQL